jgi:hypothetical protein
VRLTLSSTQTAFFTFTLEKSYRANVNKNTRARVCSSAYRARVT